jgi:hypothetical protein
MPEIRCVLKPLNCPFARAGTSLAIYCIIPNVNSTAVSTPTNMSLSFAVDGVLAPSFEHITDFSDTFNYSVPVLTIKDMANKEHTVQVMVSSVGSVTLFDYAEYT